MAKREVHKRKCRDNYWPFPFAYCGLTMADGPYLRRRWKGVTCKNCLRLKP